MAVFITLFYIAWLCAVLVLLWMIWRGGARRMQRLEQTLIDATLKTAAAAQKTADAVYLLAQDYTAERKR